MRHTLVRFILRHRIVLVLALAAVTAFFAVFAARVQFDNTIESYFLADDLRDYNRFLDQFGSDEIIVIAFEGGEIFSDENLALIGYISGKLKELPHVRRVHSLTESKIIYGDAEAVHFDRLFDESLAAAGGLNTIRRRALADPIINGTLISSDARKTAIIAEVDHIVGEFDYKVDLLNRIRHLLSTDARLSGKRFYLGGTSVLDDALFRYTQRDQTTFFPVMILVTVVVIFVLFRRVLLTVLPVAVVVLAAVWTYGLLSLLGYKVNVVSTILGPLLIAVGIADAIHFVTDYVQETASQRCSKTEAVERSFSGLLLPCFLTTVTTALGLLSLMSADLVPIRQFGLIAAAGVCFALVITLVLIPIVLSIGPVPRARNVAPQGELASPWLAWLASWRKDKAIAVLGVCGLALVPAVILLPRIQVGTNSLDYFKPDDAVRTQTEWIDANLGGTTSLEFFIDGGASDAFLEPTLLHEVEALQDYLKGIPGVTGVYSMVDLVKSLNKAFHEGDDAFSTLPDSPQAVGQQLLLIEGSKDLESFVSSDYSKARVMARVELAASQSLAHTMPQIETRARHILQSGARVTPTGLVFLMNQMERYLLASQVKSFLLAFLVITACIVIMLRSIRLGLLAMIPNVLPILFVLALMGPLGISLDVGTVMIAGVALGLVVDDSIHFLSRLRLELKQTADVPRAISDTMVVVGRPIVFTSLILALGFSVLLFASFNPVIHFGLLSGIVILLALVFDLIVLPAIAGFALRAGKGRE